MNSDRKEINQTFIRSNRCQSVHLLAEILVLFLKKRLIMFPFITPTEVFSFIVYAAEQNKGSMPPMEHYGVTNWTQ